MIGSVYHFGDRDRIGTTSRIGRANKLPSSRRGDAGRWLRAFFLVAAHARPLVLNGSAAFDFTVRLQCFSRVLTKRRVCRNHPTSADCCRKTKCEMRSTGRPTHRSFSSRPVTTNWLPYARLNKEIMNSLFLRLTKAAGSGEL